ncbi:vigilin-like [Diceros bicornis minor]|uniref:vigilin-like n=1 Tax=Diceros bicornis minor TaxID=77932 RepID=UPI0026F29F6B|nr:vigilin-like [Diceros bicornis minor]
MSSKENLTEHQSRYIQKDNYVTALNSEEDTGTPTYKDKFNQLLEKTNWLENAQEPAEFSSNNSQPLMASVITQVLYLPLEEEQYVNQFDEGRQGKFYLDIMQKTGANLELTFVKDQGLCIKVSGKPETVMKAQKEIFAWFQDQVLTTVPTPKEHHCFVKGKTGGKIQDLEQKDATNIQLLRPDNQSNWINIVDTKEVMKKALHNVLLISAEQDKCAAEKSHVKKAFYPFTPGPCNKTFDKIIQETEAPIHIPPPSVNQTQIGFTENKQQLDQAQAYVKDIFENTKKKTTPIDVEMKFQHKCTIGAKKNSVREILERTGISIEISPLESTSDSVTHHGESESLRKAFTKDSWKTKVYTVSSISVPSWLHRFIIGKKGCNISKITQNMPKIRIEFTEEDKITIKGPTEDVNYAQEQIEVIVKDLINRMDYAEINVDYKFHKHLIGKNGAIINQIEDRNKVSVLISPKNEKNNLIRIEGESQGVQQAKRELLELAGHLENEHSRDLIIEQRFHHVIIGRKGERIQDICKKFPEVKINFPDRAQKSDIVQLRGPKHEIEKCTQYLENVVTDIAESSYSVTIPIFKKPHRNVIERGGANIKKICAARNTKINPPSASGNSENIVISGKPANCEVACNWILSTQKHITNIAEVEIYIPSNLHKSLIDSKDCLIGSIMEECGRIHIHFPKTNSDLQRVIIRGPTQSVEKAKKKLLQLAEEKQTKSYVVILHVKPQYHKFLLSKNGGNVPKVCNETGACIIFPNPEDKDQELLTITGTEKAVKDAQKELEALITNLDNVVEDNILINPIYHHHFLMKGGQVLREMTEEYGGVIINFSHSGKQSNKVTIKGTKLCVEAAKKHIQEIIENLDTQVTTECVIPQKFHHFIMGPMCSRIQQITRDYNVQIKFPDKKENSVTNIDPVVQKNEEEIREKSTTEAADISPQKCDTIFISGRKEKCKAAMKALEALIPVTVEVDVPFDLHHYIIGQKGSEIQKIMDEFEVNIQMSAPGLESDTIFITGIAANVEQAKARLREQVKALQNEVEDQVLRNFKLKFTVDPKHYPKIIGRKGLVITQICLKHEVAIDFPSKGSNKIQDQITITGYENNTIAAQDTIMKMVHKFEETITKQIPLNHRVHGHIIGFHGKTIHKIMNQFQVDINFPSRRAPNPNIVTVIGLPNNVTKAIDHILSLEKHYLAVIKKHESQQEQRKKISLCKLSYAPCKSFAVKDVPCTENTIEKIPDINNFEDFPSLGHQVDPKGHSWRGKQ